MNTAKNCISKVVVSVSTNKLIRFLKYNFYTYSTPIGNDFKIMVKLVKPKDVFLI